MIGIEKVKFYDIQDDDDNVSKERKFVENLKNLPLTATRLNLHKYFTKIKKTTQQNEVERERLTFLTE